MTNMTIDKIREDTYFDEDGFLRWKSNDAVPMGDVFDLLYEGGRMSALMVKAHTKLREYENEAALLEWSIRLDESLKDDEAKREMDYELRAAFGDEAKNVVNVFTGKKVL